MPRIAYCQVCQQIEKMLDPPSSVPLVEATVAWDEGGVRKEHTFTNPETGAVMMVPEVDPLMEEFVGRHQHNQQESDVFHYIHVWSTDWKTYTQMDIAQVVKTKLAEQQGAIVEEATHLKDEALACYNKHKNPDLKDGCKDFRTDAKMIGSTKLAPKDQVYLCDMCPYTQTYIASEMRWKHGLYGNTIRRRKPRRATARRGR